MSDERDRMIETLKEYVVPVLRERGFKGSFPHFRRPTERAIHLLTFQFDKWGGGFIVEIATCPPKGVTMHWGEHVPPTKVRAWDVTRRLRLGAPDEKSDGQWFRYDKRSLFASGDRFERAALQVLPYLDGQAEDWWRRETDEQQTSA
jgi:hypothetical protein